MIADTTQLISPENPAIQVRRRIAAQDAEHVAKLVAKGLTETLAVARLGHFTIRQWFKWKSLRKNTGKFADTLARVKAARVDMLLNEIERAAHGDKDAGIRHDWRAADRLACIAMPELNPQQSQVTVSNNSQTVIACNGLPGLMRLIEAGQAEARQLERSKQADCNG